MERSREIQDNLTQIKANLKESTRKLREKAEKSRNAEKLRENLTGIKENLIQSKQQMAENVQNLKWNLPRTYDDYLEYFGYIRSIPVVFNLIGLLIMALLHMNMKVADEPCFVFISTGFQLYLIIKLLLDETKRGHWFGWIAIVVFNCLSILVLTKSTMGMIYFICPITCLFLDGIMLLISISYGIYKKIRSSTEYEEFWLYDEYEEIP